MLTSRQAAALLSDASPDGLVALARTLGFDGECALLDAATRESLGLPADLVDVSLVRGRGALRALLVEGPADKPLRGVLTVLAGVLARRTTHVLWLLLGTTSARDDTAIACWTGDHHPPRLLALVARTSSIVASDAEALCAMEASSAGDDLLVHLRWCELLGREALSRSFYRVLERRVDALARSLPRMPDADRSELALIATSRLLFLSFLQAKGWLDGDRAFLANAFDRRMARGGGFHQRVMLPLFFGTLNTPALKRAATARRFGTIPFLNGGLFARTALERRHARARLSDEALGALFVELLGAYRFTAREDRAEWSEAAVDPEMLGRAFESLMSARERRTSGAYYTPQPLVTQLAERSLVAALADRQLKSDVVQHVLDGHAVPAVDARLLASRLRSLTVLDPACGSGAFLVHLLERIAGLLRATGDCRSLAAIRRDVLGRTIHGVDVNPMAVWLCELRLWLSVVIESDEAPASAIPPLPNLDCNVRIGDALAGDAFVSPPALVGPAAVLVRLRERYLRATGARKAPLRRALAREERQRTLAALDRALLGVRAARRELLLARRGADLFGERIRPTSTELATGRALRARATELRREHRRVADGGAVAFSFPSHFAHVHARGGFELIVGNPPWVRLHNIPPSSRAALRTRYRVFREAGWEPATSLRGTHGFAAQVDLSALFVERCLELARAGSAGSPAGTIALLLPAKLWRSLSGGAVRRLLSTDAQIRRVEDWSDAPCGFDAAVYPSALIASRGRAPEDVTEVSVRRRTLDVEWHAPPEGLALDPEDHASPWLLLPPDVRRAFDLLRARGRALGDSPLGRVTLGVKCGCNDAYVVTTAVRDGAEVAVEHRGRRGVVEEGMLRPLLRGDAVLPWHTPRSSRAILWTHDERGAPLPSLPPSATRWLTPWKRRLRARTDLRGAGAWWMLFRTEGADCARTRVVWSDFGRAPRATLLGAGDPTVPLNSCYVVACDDRTDALALMALLNSPLAAAWLHAVAEPARGGWRRFLAWTVAIFPLPRDWTRARERLAPIAERALAGAPPSDDALLAAACQAYRLRRADVEPLVAWCR